MCPPLGKPGISARLRVALFRPEGRKDAGIQGARPSKTERLDPSIVPLPACALEGFSHPAHTPAMPDSVHRGVPWVHGLHRCLTLWPWLSAWFEGCCVEAKETNPAVLRHGAKGWLQSPGVGPPAGKQDSRCAGAVRSQAWRGRPYAPANAEWRRNGCDLPPCAFGTWSTTSAGMGRASTPARPWFAPCTPLSLRRDGIALRNPLPEPPWLRAWPGAVRRRSIRAVMDCERPVRGLPERCRDPHGSSGGAWVAHRAARRPAGRPP